MENYESQILIDSNTMGNVPISLPRYWGVINSAISVAFLMGVLFISQLRYDEVVVVNGALKLSAGAVDIFAPQTAILTKISVVNGQRVSKGTELFRWTANTASDHEASSESKSLSNLNSEFEIALNQESILNEERSGKLRALLDSRKLASERISESNFQLTIQEEMLKVAERDLREAAEIAQRGFLSKRDLRAREEEVLQRKQLFSRAKQELYANQQLMRELDSKESEIKHEFEKAISALKSDRLKLQQKKIELLRTKDQVITSPRGGIITAISRVPGATVNPSDPILSIVPDRNEFVAAIQVSDSVIGYISEGQKIQLSIDSVRRGTTESIDGRIMNIPQVATLLPENSSQSLRSYLVYVALDEQELRKTNRMISLKDGMRVSARIKTKNQSVLNWILDSV